MRSAGDLTVSGDVMLNNAVLYVDGNLNISGGLHGTGAVYTTGSAAVSGTAAVSATEQMALVAGGDVTLAGQGTGASFRGVVYTGGNLRVTSMMLDGAFVGNNSQTSSVRLDDVQLLYDPKMTQMIVPVPVGPPPTATGFAENSMTDQIPLPNPQYNLTVYNTESPLSKVIQNNQVVSNPALLSGSEYHLDVMTSAPFVNTVLAQHGSYPLVATSNPASNSAWYPVSSWADINAGGYTTVTIVFPTQAAADAWITGVDPTVTQAQLDSVWSQVENNFLGNITNQLQNYLQQVANYQSAAGGVVNYKFDLNQFILPADRARVLIWRRL